MTEQVSNPSRPDAFKARMAEAKAAGRPELANQSLGRPTTDPESNLADALMALFTRGISGAAELANGLTEMGILRPSSGQADWTKENLAAEMATLNADFDRAYQENGFGA